MHENINDDSYYYDDGEDGGDSDMDFFPDYDSE